VSVVREVELRRLQIDRTFARAAALATAPDAETVQADYARYLCILLSGFVEKSLADLAVAYTRDKAAAPIRAYVENVFARVTNVDKERLLQVMGSFDASWREQVDKFVIDEKQAALNSIVGLRNNIAHGGAAALSLGQIERYWAQVTLIVHFVETLFFPTPPVYRVKSAKKK
jgi:hypothetical protein